MGKHGFKKRKGPSLEERKKKMKAATRQLLKEEREKNASTKPKFTIDQLLDKAENCIDMFEYELAQKFCQRALEMEPDNVRALETCGALLIDLGQLESAKQCFGRAVTVCPDSGYSKYMNLGQLFEGAQAVECFQKGIELMIAEKAERESQEIAAACGGGEQDDLTDRSISDAYLSIAEMYLTDCCFDESAAEKCKEHIDKALSMDKDNPDALRVLASFQLSKGDSQEACENIKKSVNLWLPEYQASDQPGTSADAPLECSESFSSRLNAGKILIEVGEHETLSGRSIRSLTNLPSSGLREEMAVEVLETLIEEDDEVVDVWYLIGWAYHCHGDHENARSYLNKAKKVYRKTKCEDEEILKHVDELLAELGEGKDVMDSDAEADEDDDEYEDIDTDEEEEENGDGMEV